MREIKFRAWDKANNYMIQNNKILKICFVRSNHLPNLIVYAKRPIENHTEIKEIDKNYCNEFEIMQYTGLKDKNGKEIYEGDILKAKTTAIIIKEVVYDEDYARFGLKDKEEIYDVMQEIYALSKEKIQSLKFEVIGNIYENKELLKNEK